MTEIVRNGLERGGRIAIGIRITLTGALWLLYATFASGQEFDGLYYPKDDPEPWNCKKEDIGQIGGALGVVSNKFFGLENTCTLTNPRETDDGTEFIGQCEAEGVEYRNIYTLKRTPKGLAVTSEGHTAIWNRCPQNPPTQSTTKPISPDKNSSNWVSGSAMGVDETRVDNQQGENIIFSCDRGSDSENAAIDFELKKSISGVTTIKVDDQPFSFITVDHHIGIRRSCPLCVSDYTRLMQAVLFGTKLSVRQGTGKPSVFNITGAREAFDDRVCMQPDQHSLDASPHCQLTVKGKVAYDGKCSVEPYGGDDLIIRTATRGYFVLVFKSNNGKSSDVHWNGFSGGNHAHNGLGKMWRDGGCWTNQQSSICYSQ